ncbi:PAS domain-containing protein [Futiania mangrovi]|uniref:PAS domain-containing protein n=1 Tax=Futiania mangrovi TaxID=2959716 RepID=A0A9J6PF86_9PROT|nr:PAS domain-containing protein [Futiania mangrovii]MCP1336459.1 PAS domain-containing protein [Futiania mangrovii]
MSRPRTPPEGTIATRRMLRVCTAETAHLFGYWDRVRDGRQMPRRADINPMDIAGHLPSVLLIDVTAGPGGLVYRLIGTNVQALRGGNDPSGLAVADEGFGQPRENVVENYRFVSETGSFLYDPRPYHSARGLVCLGETLFLPLSDDGMEVTQILAYAHRGPWRTPAR